VLSDEKQKQMYDQFGEEGLNGAGFDPMGGMDPAEIFSQVFGMSSECNQLFFIFFLEYSLVITGIIS
jgi:DnaJ-class molecular chaperone